MGEPDSERRRRIAAWVGAYVIPHEANVRAWLRRTKVSPEDIDDVIQEAYCKLASLDGYDHIERPDAYFFSVVRNLLLRRIRRASVVPLTTIAEIEAFDDDRPSPEREVAAQREYARIRGLIDLLPDRCRQIFEMRRVQGLSQRQIAETVGISEGMVEYHVSQGVKAIVRGMKMQEEEAHSRADTLLRTEKRS